MLNKIEYNYNYNYNYFFLMLQNFIITDIIQYVLNIYISLIDLMTWKY
jgi:hypothetical protein